MIESTTDISSEMKSMEAELEQNESLSRELLQIRVSEASKFLWRLSLNRIKVYVSRVVAD